MNEYFDKKLIDDGIYERGNFKIRYEIDTKMNGNNIFDFVVYETSDIERVDQPFKAHFCRVMLNPDYDNVKSKAIFLLKKQYELYCWSEGFEYDKKQEKIIYGIDIEKYEEFNQRILNIMARLRKDDFDYKEVSYLIFDYLNFILENGKIEKECDVEGIFLKNDDLEFEIVG